MQFTDTDFQQTEQVAQIVLFCDQADNQTLEQVADEIYCYQPFLISIFLGYKDDVDIFQHDELLRVLIIIWLFFKDRPNVKRIKITEKMFEATQRKNAQFLKYLEGEPNQKAKEQITDLNLGALKAKALFSVVFFKIKDGAALKKLDIESIGIILLGMKSLIECFEQISKPKRRRTSRR